MARIKGSFLRQAEPDVDLGEYGISYFGEAFRRVGGVWTRIRWHDEAFLSVASAALEGHFEKVEASYEQ